MSVPNGRPGWSAAEVDGYSSKVRGCLLGGAVGDALGAPVEFWTREQIVAATGGRGVRSYLPARFGDVEGVGLVTDDTQMTLFIAEGIIRARVREDRGLGFTVAVTHHAMQRWLDTQEHPGPTGQRDGWLAGQGWLYSRRAPGSTCLAALRAADPAHFGSPAVNGSKGCGAVMRSAPFGLLVDAFGAEAVYPMAVESASYTHGHATGQVAAGALAHLIAGLVTGRDLQAAVEATIAFLADHDPNGQTTRALTTARDCGQSGSATPVESLGGGWVAEEALAIAVHCALRHPEPENMLDALALAVTHSGDSDSTGAICGNILGAAHGASALPAELVIDVEGRAPITQLADDLVLEMTAGQRLHSSYGVITSWTQRYPGW